MESDIVGYSTITLKPGYNMVAVNFENLADTNGVSIQDLFPGTTEGFKGGTIETGDTVMTYDATTGIYATYYLFNTTLPLPDLQAKNGKWVFNGDVSNRKFKSGETFWYNLKGDKDVTITIAGAVSAVASHDLDIVKGFNMIASAFPANFNPNTLGTEFWQNSGAKGGTVENGDNFMVYDNGNYVTYYLSYTTLPIPDLQAKNWKWVKSDNTILEVNEELLKAGIGVWYNHKGDGFKLSIPRPNVD